MSPYPLSDLPKPRVGHTLQLALHGFLFGLALRGVFPATLVAKSAVRSYRTISPLPTICTVGGIFSVALSVGSRLPGVTWHVAR